MKTNLFLKSLIGAALLSIIFLLTNLALGLPLSLTSILWGIVANYLVALVLGYLIIYSIYQGLKLYLIVFLVYFIIGHFNLLIEAYIFNVTNRQETGMEIIRGFIVSLVFAPTFCYLFPKNPNPEPRNFAKRSLLSWAWRIVTGNILYLFLYLLAGFILITVYPQLMEFYQDKIPPMDVMLNTQLFLRGFLFMGIAILLSRVLQTSRQKTAIYIGLVFAILGALAPLIPPSELMPGYVRLGHGFEVVSSNFLYGFILGYLLGQKHIGPNATQNTEL